MNDIRDKLKSLSDNRKRAILIAIGVILLLLLLVLESGDGNDEAVTKSQKTAVAEEYIESTEKQLQKILSQVEGAGEVYVMITLESCYENVYATDYTAKNENQKESSDSNITEELVVVENQDGENGVVIKVYEPVVKGVAVVCQGADSVKVRSAIIETVCALFDISSTKVSVTKGYKE